jgi:predicted Zn finger-like uncharacterized protein
METRIACPHCRYAFRITDDLLGKRLRCLVCRTLFVAGQEQVTPGKKATPYPKGAAIEGDEEASQLPRR